MLATLNTAPTPPDTPALKPLKIIIADDVPEIRQLVGEWLQEQGHAVSQASGGREVLRLALGEAYDLVVTDILMPDGDGLDVIIALKRSQPGTRILGISGGGKHMGAGDALRLAQAIGADGMLLKPFSRRQLLEAVDRAMLNQRR